MTAAGVAVALHLVLVRPEIPPNTGSVARLCAATGTVLHLVELSRFSFMAAYRPVDGVNVLYPLMFALCVAALGMALYRTNRLRLISS